MTLTKREKQLTAKVGPAVDVTPMRRGRPYVIGKFYAVYPPEATKSDALLAMVVRGPFDTAQEAADEREQGMCVTRECA